MWMIFFQDAPKFWLLGGTSYRVGKKDCAVQIEGDRSISRTHLTIMVGLASPSSSVSSSALDVEGLPQPITLVDSSTYGTAVACGDAAMQNGSGQTGDDAHSEKARRRSSEGDCAQGFKESATIRPAVANTSSVPGITLHDGGNAPDATLHNRQHHNSASGHDSVEEGMTVTTTTAALPTLRLAKGVPWHVPVHRLNWQCFTMRLGHHGAALRLVWLPIAVLCEDVEVESQAPLVDALRRCGVRRVVEPENDSVSSATQDPAAEDTPLSEEGGGSGADGDRGRRPRLESSCAPRSSAAVMPVPSSPAVRSPVGAASAPNGDGDVPGPMPPATAAVPPLSSTRCCYNDVSFLVTSCVQPSTAVVAMLCRGIPIVTPAFFGAICDRGSPQVPLPDPAHFLPPLSMWWRDLLSRVLARKAVPPPQATPTDGEESTASTASLSTSPPHLSSTAASFQAVLQNCFAPHAERRHLFRGLTFVVVQRTLYDEVAGYLDSTGARLVWEGLESGDHLLTRFCGGMSDSAAAAPPPRAALEALQAFFHLHQRHVILFDASEVGEGEEEEGQVKEAGGPRAEWVDVLQHGLGLSCVEYGAVIDSVVSLQPLTVPAFPADSRVPQTWEEINARVAVAAMARSNSKASPARTKRLRDSTTPLDTGEQEGRGRGTDARPLFPELGDGKDGNPHPLRPPGFDGDADARRGTCHGARPNLRPRVVDSDGWVTLEKPVASAESTPGLDTRAGGHRPCAALRTVELHCGPFPLPPYPCFVDAKAYANHASATRSATSFVKQVLPPGEPLVELDGNRADRPRAAPILSARLPTVDADDVVPDRVVMGDGGLASRVTDATNDAFNVFDTVAHHAASRRRGTAARRGRTGANAAAGSRGRGNQGGNTAPTTRRQTASTPIVQVESESESESETVRGAEDGEKAMGRSSDGFGGQDTAAFHIFDIDGIF